MLTKSVVLVVHSEKGSQYGCPFCCDKGVKMAVSNNDKLNKMLVQVRRIAEHREVDAEKAIRREYKKLHKEIKEFINTQYAELLESGELTFDILANKQMQARFLEEVQAKVDGIMPNIQKEVTELIDETNELSYAGMVQAVRGAASTEEMKQLLQGATINPEIIRAGVNNTLVNKIVLNDVLEKNRREVIYNIKRDISIGLSNGDRVDTMAKRISKTLDGDYKKAVRVARTESHRTVEAGLSDAATELDTIFKDSGEDIRMVKIWRTMKDSRVRPQRKKGKKGGTVMGHGANHIQMEGKAALVDDKFELSTGAMTIAPGQSGEASEDINCRCFLEYNLMTDAEYFAVSGKHFPNYRAAAVPQPKTKEEKIKAKEEEFKPLIDVKGDPLDIDNQMAWENIRSKDITKAEHDKIYGDGGYDGYIQTSHSWTLNNKMRKNPNAELSDIFKGKDLETVEALHNVIQRNEIPFNTTVVRKSGTNFARESLRMNVNALNSVIQDFDKDYIQESLADYIGDRITEHSFVSTSANMELNVFNYKPISLEFRVPKGTKAFITENYAESEVIFDRGFTYEIMGFDIEQIGKRKSLKIIAKVVQNK